ncbi:TOMM precursor leader peptide-binding protein [Actinomadura sp. NPDC048021]|uniref:TOMM precursor leader peptide-binding protein n=1 Tax=Actinomadura sp. NPDC048021 TaxID=3155385 RepID=UPI0033D3A07A
MTAPDLPTAAFLVLGEGVLRDAVAGTLAEYGTVLPTVPEPAPMGDPHSSAIRAVVSLSDIWRAEHPAQLRRWRPGLPVPRLPVRARLGTVVMGPLDLPGTTGCGLCMHMRARRVRPGLEDTEAVREAHSAALSERPSSWLTTLSCDTVAALVAAEMTRLVRPTNPVLPPDPSAAPLTHRAVLHVDLEQLAVTRHPFLPEPLCPECGTLPDDGPEHAQLVISARPKPAPDHHRIGLVHGRYDAVLDTYVDAQAGMIPALGHDTQGGLVVAVAPLPLRAPGRTEHGFGRTRSHQASSLTAVLEALERWGGVEPGGKRTVVRGTYADLAGRALDPRVLGEHSEQSYRLPGFGYRRFTEDAVCDWVWGYSFARREPILLPQTFAYYGGPHRRASEERPFAYETSNGCALGSCLEEAIIYGILEVAERDAFLMTWYARISAPLIDLESCTDRTVPLQAAAITARTGYRVRVHDTTLEHGVPTVWAMAVHPGDHAFGGRAGGLPRTVSAAGSHLLPEKAVLNALSELGPILADRIRRHPAEQQRAKDQVDDAYLVETMADHALLYGAWEAYDRLGFLTEEPATCAMRDLAARRDGELRGPGGFHNDDLRDDLAGLVRRYTDGGMDVVVVDQTTPEHQAGRLACVKVLIPGTLPMTFGHQHRRTHGLPRLRDVPHRLGHTARPLRHDEMNDHPHPFP